MGLPDGMLRAMPGWETEVFGSTISWNIFLPGVLLPVVMWAVFMAYPFVEAWITGDKREHHLLQRPRNAPTRTAFLAAMMTMYGVLWAESGNDILAITFHLNINYFTYAVRVLVFVAPVVVFVLTRRWCISLQRADRDRLLHGYETGVIMRSPDGGYAEKHLPIGTDEAYTLTARERDQILPPPTEEDENGVPNRQVRAMRLRARLSRYWFGPNVQKPTLEELEAARRHAEAELAADDDGPPELTTGQRESSR
jgi:ubiquinol-cytochrome c reductase cytochrome b subunit